MRKGRNAEGGVSSTSWYPTLLKVSAINSRNMKRVPHKHKRRLTVRRLLLFLAVFRTLVLGPCDRFCEFGASFCERRTLECRALLILRQPEQRRRGDAYDSNMVVVWSPTAQCMSRIDALDCFSQRRICRWGVLSLCDARTVGAYICTYRYVCAYRWSWISRRVFDLFRHTSGDQEWKKPP